MFGRQCASNSTTSSTNFCSNNNNNELNCNVNDSTLRTLSNSPPGISNSLSPLETNGACMNGLHGMLQLSPNSIMVGKKQSRPTFTGHQANFY